jgi:hypothetical protein
MPAYAHDSRSAELQLGPNHPRVCVVAVFRGGGEQSAGLWILHSEVSSDRPHGRPLVNGTAGTQRVSHTSRVYTDSPVAPSSAAVN